MIINCNIKNNKESNHSNRYNTIISKIINFHHPIPTCGAIRDWDHHDMNIKIRRMWVVCWIEILVVGVAIMWITSTTIMWIINTIVVLKTLVNATV